MAKKRMNDITIEGAQILFRNFSGKQSQFNPKGDKSFSVVIPTEIVGALESDGWNIKYLKGREDGDPDLPILNVAVRYGVVNPQIYLVTKKSKQLLTDDTVGVLDSSDILNVDVIITPYTWEVSGKSGIKAYVKTMYVTIQEDQFAGKYNFDEDIPF